MFRLQNVLLTFYTGCPSLAELSKIWPHLVDANSSNAAWESPSTSALPKTKSSDGRGQHLEQQPEKNGFVGLANNKLGEGEKCTEEYS